MENNDLSKKIALVVAASISALTVSANSLPMQANFTGNKTIEHQQIKTVKPMPVLKLNFSDPSASKFFASHRSHSSHHSHRSHHSHYSSHR